MSCIQQLFVGYAGDSLFVFNQTISANTANYNLRDAAVAAGWDQVIALDAKVTINSGVYVYSTSTGSYAFDTGATFPNNTKLELINNGIILGMGGSGSTGGSVNSAGYMNGVGYDGAAGGVGGPSLIARYQISITNNGVISGGGGGGGGGSAGFGNN